MEKSTGFVGEVTTVYMVYMVNCKPCFTSIRNSHICGTTLAEQHIIKTKYFRVVSRHDFLQKWIIYLTITFAVPVIIQ